MSRRAIGVLLAVFAVVLIFSASALVGTSNDPRPVPTDTPGPSADGGEDGDPVAVGRSIYEARCALCHTTDGSTLVGPTWQGLFGHEVTLSDGSTVTADEAYITESIRDPGAQVVEGFQNIMPPFPDLTDEQISAIIAFMETLE